MTWQKGQTGNPKGFIRPERPFREALRLEIAEVDGDRKKLRKIAAALVKKAQAGDVQAVKEIADRLDGKVPQALIGDNDADPIKHVITWKDEDD